MNNKKIINQLIAILKKERGIINFLQIVESISIMILVRYFEVKIKNNKNKKYLKYDNQNLTAYVDYCKNILEESSYLIKDRLNLPNLNSLLFNFLEKIYLKIDANTIFNEINPTLFILKDENDFLNNSEDYRVLINEMTFESSQTGQYYTPKAIGQLLVNVLKPKCGDQVYDPACGSAGFLLEADRYIQRNTPCTQHKLIGSDISLLANIISFVSFILNKNKEFHLELIDSINSKNILKIMILL